MANITHPREVVNEGDVVNVRVLRVEPGRRRLGLSLKQAGGLPLEVHFESDTRSGLTRPVARSHPIALGRVAQGGALRWLTGSTNSLSAPARSLLWPKKRPSASTTTTSAPSTCCLGLVREGDGVAAKVLANMGVELNKVRSAVEFIIGRGDRMVMGEIGLTPRAKKVIELAVDEARRLNHHYIGTEHLAAWSGPRG